MKFSYLSTLNRRRQNRIIALQDQGGNWSTYPICIHYNITQYYQKLFATQKLSSPRTYRVKPFNVLSLSDQSCLTNPLQDWKIIQVIKSLKALGQDGLNPYFFQKYWHIVGNSVKTFCHKAFNENQIEPSINNTFICLIPKNKHAATICQYRPISLWNTIYKVITKIILINSSLSYNS